MIRASGVLMPIFSLPGKYGIGTFGKEAYEFVDFLKDVKSKYWQILPIHPLTYGNSPYQSTSTYAGNTLLIDLDSLYEKGLLKKTDYKGIDFGKDKNRIDYAKVTKEKNLLINKAARKLVEDEIEKTEYEKFKEEYSYFLDEYAIFSVIKDRYKNVDFSNWDRIHRLHFEEVIKEFAYQNTKDIETYKAMQFLFFKQWFLLKQYANENGVKIIGDMPIYSSLDSVEVFSDYKNFYLDKDRKPIEVAGCPPDAFSADGQFWRNPLYDYDYMKEDGYKYFINRISHLRKLYDVIRIDHFRGFASYYAVPSDAKTAKEGSWKIGPGISIFEAINENVKNLEIIAEDLGLIDEAVHKLLAETGYPGMKVVEFAFGYDIENHPYLPKNYDENCVAYLGTHDNNTFMGWYDELNEDDRSNVKKYLNLKTKGREHLEAIEELFKSKSNLTIVMMQDLLGLGSEARINTPSTVGDNNWSYRFSDNYISEGIKEFLKNVIVKTNR